VGLDNSMKVRWKLVTLLVVPLLALSLLGYVGINDRQDVVRAANQQGATAEWARQSAVTTDALDREALAAALVLHTPDAAHVKALADVKARTNTALDGLRKRSSLLNGEQATSFRSTLAGLEDLRRITSANGLADTQDNRDGQVEALLAGYGNTSGYLLDIGASTIGDGDSFTANMRAYQALRVSREQAFQALALLTLRGAHMPIGPKGVQDSVSQYVGARSVFTGLAPTDQVRHFNQTVLPAVSQTVTSLEAAANQGDSTLATVMSLPNDSNALAVLDVFRKAESDFEQSMIKSIDAHRHAASSDVKGFLYLMITITAFALVSASILSRAISGPLNRLTREARKVADVQLPALLETLRDPASADHLPAVEPLPTSTNRDEIGDLSRAFDAIQHAAVGVAAEQSVLLRKGIGELFVNLARRNQSLLDRQIGLLDDLENSETDPDALGQLFRLDHLATRMRRNAESLLVLAGVDSPRRWAQVMPLVDVLKAATGEVEDYSRVTIHTLPIVGVQGLVAADLAHLVAELLDNATQFSPPTSRVEVHGRMTEGSCVLEVRDTGIGMNPDQLAEANRTLHAPPVNGLALSRSLGFIVVGRLAERHGVTVTLERGESGGVVARVVVPASVLGETVPANSVDAGPSTAAPATAAPWAPPVELPRTDLTKLKVYNSEELEPSAPPAEFERVPVNNTARASHADDETGNQSPDTEPMSTTPEAAEPLEADPSAGPLHRDIPLELWARLVGPASSAWGDTEMAPAVPASAAPEFEAVAEPVFEPTPEPEPQLRWESPQSLDEALAVGSSGPDVALAGLVEDAPRSVAAASPEPGGWARRAPEAREYGAVTAAGLPRRRSTRSASVVEAHSSSSLDGDGAVASTRSPDEIRALLSTYRNGLTRGRISAPDQGATE